MRAALVSPTTLLHSGSHVSAQPLSYSDANHFLWDSAVHRSATRAEASSQALDQKPRRTDLESNVCLEFDDTV